MTPTRWRFWLGWSIACAGANLVGVTFADQWWARAIAGSGIWACAWLAFSALRARDWALASGPGAASGRVGAAPGRHPRGQRTGARDG